MGLHVQLAPLHPGGLVVRPPQLCAYSLRTAACFQVAERSSKPGEVDPYCAHGALHARAPFAYTPYHASTARFPAAPTASAVGVAVDREQQDLADPPAPQQLGRGDPTELPSSVAPPATTCLYALVSVDEAMLERHERR